MKVRLAAFIMLFALWASPALAQDNSAHKVTFDGFGFSFTEEVAANVNIVGYPGDPASQGPGAAEVRHRLFMFYRGAAAPESPLDAAGAIRVYRLEDVKGYAENQKRVEQLQSLLDKRPDLKPYIATARSASENNLPFLPVYPAGQVLRARPAYVDTAAVKGISYVTVYQEAAEPLLSNSLTYTFQGISTDGKLYISATFKLTTSLFPANVAADFDAAFFASRYGEYMAKSTALVDRAAPTEFTPSLTTLDALIQSISIAK